MNKFNYKSIERTFSLLLVSIFLFTFPAGATDLAFCLDEQNTHIVGQRFYLVDCHSSAGIYLPLSSEHNSVFTDNENNDCTDVSLTNANILNRPTKIRISGFAKLTLSYVLPKRPIRFQQETTGIKSSFIYQHLTTLPDSASLRNVVLLI